MAVNLINHLSIDKVLGKENSSQLELLGSEEILNSLVLQFEKVDFRELAYGDEYVKLLEKFHNENVGAKEEISKRLEKFKIDEVDYYIITVDEIIRVSNNKKLDIIIHNEVPFIYNGAYWIQVERIRFESFISEVAQKIGVPRKKAKNYQFREKLSKQFWTEAKNISTSKLDNNKVAINLKNGVLEFEGGEWKRRSFKKDFFFTYILGYEFNQETKAPLFQEFLDKVVPDKSLQLILAEYIGYIFIPNNYQKFKAEKVLILFGTGANGKSVFNAIIKALIGEENITDFSLSSLTTESNGSYRARIENKLLNYSTELGRRSDADLFKKLASGEPVDARPLYQNPYTITRYAKLIFNANELPRDVEHKDSYFRRFLIVPFEVTIPENEQDKGIAQRIIDSELSGILNWALEGLLRLLKQGRFTQSELSEKYLKEYQEESDSIKLFIKDMELVPSETKYHTLKTLYSGYREYCQECGYKPFSNVVFSRKLRELKIRFERMTNGYKCFIHSQIIEDSEKFQKIATSAS